MHRTAILGVLILLAAPLAPIEIPTFFDRLTLKAELDTLAGGIQGLGAAHVSADPSRRELVIQGLALRRAGLSLRIGRLTLRLAAPRPFFAGASFMQAFAATDIGAKPAAKSVPGTLAPTGTVAADDISLDTEALHATIKHIDMAGTQLSNADLAALFDAHATVPLAERLAKISAAHVAISEIVLKSKQEAEDRQIPTLDNKLDGDTDRKADGKSWDEKIVLRDIAMDDVLQGRARRTKIGATSVVVRAADAGEMQAALGPMRITGLDLAQAARLLPGAGTTGPRQKLCDSLDVDGVKVSAPKAEFGFGTIAVKDVKASSLQSLLKSGDGAETDKPAGERATAFARLLADVDIGSLTFTDLRFATPNATTPWTGGISRGFLTRIAAAKIGEAGLQDFAVAGDGAKVKIGRLAWHEPDAQIAKQKDTENKLAAEGGSAPVDQQSVTADALDIDIANLDSYRAPAGSPTHFQLSHFKLTSSNPIAGVPTHMKADFDHFVFDVGTMKDDLAAFATLGYGKLDLSSRFEAHFSNENSEFDLDALSLSGADMGVVRLSGRLDHVTKALFSSDQTEMETGLIGLLLRRIEIRVENDGFFERLVAATAKKDNATEIAIRKKFTDAVTRDVPALLDNGRGADAITAALAKFIAQPKTFRLSVTAPEGIGALEVVLIKDPATLLQKVDIEAGADE